MVLFDDSEHIPNDEGVYGYAEQFNTIELSDDTSKNFIADAITVSKFNEMVLSDATLPKSTWVVLAGQVNDVPAVIGIDAYSLEVYLSLEIMDAE